MSVKLKYQSKELSRNKNQESYKETFYGSSDEIDAFISTLPAIGTSVSGKGYFTSYNKTQSEGSIYQVETQYTIEYDESFSNTSSTVVGQKSASLSVRNIQMPLQAHVNYLTCWNYYLIGLGDAETPQWHSTAKDTLINVDDRKSYQWVKSTSQMPLEANEDGQYWHVLEQPIKPGVEYFDKACFVVTQSAKFNSSGAAGSSISANINTITPPQNTFNVTYGDWKYDQASVQYDGKHWIATSTYTHSGDSLGWDQQPSTDASRFRF